MKERMVDNSNGLLFKDLVSNIDNICRETNLIAKRAINKSLTLRNWVIGYYIVEYEQKGDDRAKYGTSLLNKLAIELDAEGLDRTMLNLCRSFYLKYPQIREIVSHKLALIEHDENGICETSHKYKTDGEILVRKLSFSHIRELMQIEDPIKRFFYETE